MYFHHYLNAYDKLECLHTGIDETVAWHHASDALSPHTTALFWPVAKLTTGCFRITYILENTIRIPCNFRHVMTSIPTCCSMLTWFHLGHQTTTLVKQERQTHNVTLGGVYVTTVAVEKQ